MRMLNTYKIYICCILFCLTIFQVAAQKKINTPIEEQAVKNLDFSVNNVMKLRDVYPSLTGKGIVASIKENLFDTLDIDLKERYLPSMIQSPSISTHATTMASIIGGNGILFHTSRGVAGKVGLSSANFLQLFPDENQYFISNNITVQNHSYGIEVENYYGVEAAAYDTQSDELPELLHVFSAGNAGQEAADTGKYEGLTGFANLSGNFKLAKNIITVGAIDSFYQIESRSSRGPASDGRVKPGLVAFGQDGSSGAAAITSGTAILLQQQFFEQYGFLPDAALIKGILINSAEDLGNLGPDFTYGYGNLNALQAIETLENEQFLEGIIKNQEAINFSISIPENIQDLKVTLIWADAPANEGDSIALKNDLDIKLSHQESGNTYLPWVLNTAPFIDSLSLPAKRGVDRLNNQEQITIKEVPAGNYTINIKGFDIETNQQSFYVIYEWETKNNFRWTYPSRSTNMLGGEAIPLRWISNISDTAALEYRYVSSDEWIPITNVDLKAAAFALWEVPDTFALAQLRMTAKDTVVYSDTFSISSILNLQVGFNCDDNLLLFWESTTPNLPYQIYALEEQAMKPTAVTTDTFIILDQENLATHYAVAPILSPGKQGERSFALDINQQRVGCYLNNFLADLNNNQVILSATIGTNYQLASIQFEKENNGTFQALESIEPVNDLSYTYIDAELKGGLNTYRLTIFFEDGSSIISNQLSIFYIEEQTYQISPNLIDKTQSLRVLSNSSNRPDLFFYDAMGRLVFKEPLFSNFEFFPVQNLSSGVYFYQIIDEGILVKQGKVLIY